MENKELKSQLLLDKSYDQLASFYFIFADATRLKIVNLLIKASLCVSEIADILGVSSSVISHQLAILKNHDVVSYKRVGKSIIYSLSDEHIKLLFESGLEHICEKKIDIKNDVDSKK